MKVTDGSDLEELSHDEIAQIIHDPHVTADQLNIVAAYFRHLNAIKSSKVKELESQMAKVDKMLAELDEK